MCKQSMSLCASLSRVIECLPLVTKIMLQSGLKKKKKDYINFSHFQKYSEYSEYNCKCHIVTGLKIYLVSRFQRFGFFFLLAIWTSYTNSKRSELMRTGHQVLQSNFAEEKKNQNTVKIATSNKQNVLKKSFFLGKSEWKILLEVF